VTHGAGEWHAHGGAWLGKMAHGPAVMARPDLNSMNSDLFKHFQMSLN
jgi:hypothetical protein